MKYIDVHSHVYFPQYDTDRDEAISRASSRDVGIITVGTDLESSRKAVELAEKNKNMWAIVGIHPADVGVANGKDAVIFDYQSFRKLARHPKVVAIGECGFDYFHEPFDPEYQREIFIKHIDLANEVGKPLMLHVRNAKNGGQGSKIGRNTYMEALELLMERARVAFNFHFFAGTPADLDSIVAAGGFVSFTGVVTFVGDYNDLVAKVPLDRIMSETDAPFVAPAPYRGKRNEPAYVVEVAEKIADIRESLGENRDIVLGALVNNAKKFFSI